MSKSIALYRGRIQDDSFYFSPIINGTRIHSMILDTRAFELTFNRQTATLLNLPNLGMIQVRGVGGSAQAYQSRCSITISGNVYDNVPCVVDPSLTETGLFGLRFFIDNSLTLALNPVAQTLRVLTA